MMYGDNYIEANFVPISGNYSVNVSATPSAGGFVSGGGSFAEGSFRTVTATAHPGFYFGSWTEHGGIVCILSNYTFRLNKNRDLVGNFAAITTTSNILSLGGLSVSSGMFRFVLSGSVGTNCVIEASSNLVIWSPISTNTIPASGSIIITDQDSANYPWRFYRAVIATPVSVPQMVSIPPGTFTMGSPNSEPARNADEGPLTLVTISRGFWMGKYEVTQGEYLAVTGSNPSFFNGVLDWIYPDNDFGTDLTRPVEMVSWDDATNYCAMLTAQERNAGRLPSGYVYRLPTEAEWEYACPAGTTTPFHYGNALRSGMANFYGLFEYPPCGASTWGCYNASGVNLERTTAVGSYAPNAWGLYDMHGNVWEWCQDAYGSHAGGSVTDPQGPGTNSNRVFRGGSWDNGGACNCRSAYRGSGPPDSCVYGFGFRVVLAPGQP